MHFFVKSYFGLLVFLQRKGVALLWNSVNFSTLRIVTKKNKIIQEWRMAALVEMWIFLWRFSVCWHIPHICSFKILQIADFHVWEYFEILQIVASHVWKYFKMLQIQDFHVWKPRKTVIRVEWRLSGVVAALLYNFSGSSFSKQFLLKKKRETGTSLREKETETRGNDRACFNLLGRMSKPENILLNCLTIKVLWTNISDILAKRPHPGWPSITQIHRYVSFKPLAFN